MFRRARAIPEPSGEQRDLSSERGRMSRATTSGVPMQRELVERAMVGDREAFTELGRLWIDRLYAVARLILRDSDRAQDASQEALIAAWRDPTHPAHHRLIVNPHAAFYSEQGFLDMRTRGSQAIRRALLGERLRNVVN